MSILSTASEDQLYMIFERHLHSGLYDAIPMDRFIQDVVDFYWRTLLTQGHVPQHMQGQLKDDLVEDVQAMLKAKIYGHPSIGEYNRRRLGKKQKKSS